MHEGGVVRYGATDRAGVYRLVQGDTALERAVNFFDAVESNTQARCSTWAVEEPASPSVPAARVPTRPSSPLSHGLIGAVLALLVVEWLLYARKGGARE